LSFRKRGFSLINKDEDLGAYLNWKIGNKTLTTLSDGYNPIDYDTVHSIPKEVGIYLQREAHRTDNPIFTHNMFLIRGDDHPPILIDAGMGGSAGPTLGWLTSSLAKAGVKKEEIGLILMTHLHPDHCGGLVDENGESVFPNATLVVHEDEIDFWLTLEGEQRSPESLKPFF
jgi:glyoxylase-like metal-dependent hydrolase (beta-lactamase superfamily II)